MVGLKDMIEVGAFDDKRLVFWHTGGMPSIHAFGRPASWPISTHSGDSDDEDRLLSRRSGFLKGALLGLGYYLCDALGAYLAIPELLDPTLDTIALLVLGALHVMFWTGLLGIILHLFYPTR